jgi:hypothetical protein
MDTTTAERIAQANDHKEFLATCEAYDTLEGEAKEKADADIAAYVEKRMNHIPVSKVAHMSENEYETWLERNHR